MVDIVDSHRVLEVGLAEKKEFSVPIFLLLSAIGTAAYMMYEDYKKSKYSWKMKQAFKWF